MSCDWYCQSFQRVLESVLIVLQTHTPSTYFERWFQIFFLKKRSFLHSFLIGFIAFLCQWENSLSQQHKDLKTFEEAIPAATLRNVFFFWKTQEPGGWGIAWFWTVSWIRWTFITGKLFWLPHFRILQEARHPEVLWVDGGSVECCLGWRPP